MFVSNGIINGAGHTLVTTVVSLVSLWVVRGRLDLSDLRLRPAGVLKELLSLGGLGDQAGQAVRVGGLDFRIERGAIRYDNFPMTFGGQLDLVFSGAVRFDDGLEMTVSVPVRAALLERLGVKGPVAEYARLLEGTRIGIPLVGSRLNRNLETSTVDLRPLVAKAAEALLKKEVGARLGEILRGPGAKPGTQPARPPALPLPIPLPLPRPAKGATQPRR
jgi:hypothetical protein